MTSSDGGRLLLIGHWAAGAGLTRVLERLALEHARGADVRILGLVPHKAGLPQAEYERRYSRSAPAADVLQEIGCVYVGNREEFLSQAEAAEEALFSEKGPGFPYPGSGSGVGRRALAGDGNGLSVTRRESCVHAPLGPR